MWNRFTRGTAVIASTLLTVGMLGSTVASADAGPGTSRVGYEAGNGAWSFRYVTSTFPVPLLACTGQDDFIAGGVELLGSLGDATVGLGCAGAQPVAFWGFVSLNHSTEGTLLLTGHDSVTLSVYYDETTGYDYFYAKDNTTGRSADWAHKAGVAQYRYADAGLLINNPLQHPPKPGTNVVLTGPFTATTVTSADGTHGTGINGPWGYKEVSAFNGGHLIAAAPVLYDDWTTFNCRIYGAS